MPLLPYANPKTGSSTPDIAFREHIKTVAIPKLEGLFILLLHDLSFESKIVDKKQEKHIAEAFSDQNMQCVDNFISLRLADPLVN